MNMTRRQCLATAGGAFLAAASTPALATVGHGHEKDNGEQIYAHGMVWNRDLPGIAGDLKLSFDLRVDLETGTGFGTASDPIYPDWNIHFAMDSTDQQKLPGGDGSFTMTGSVTRAVNPDLVGVPIRIRAETRGEATAIAIAIGDLTFSGAGLLVVIAIIAILIS